MGFVWEICKDINENKAAPFPDSEEKIQLFTGRKDKNSKEIFEGDIVKYFNLDPIVDTSLEDCQKEYTRGVIERIGASFRVCQEYVGGEYLDKYCCCNEHSNLEIIGNIYQSPEKQN